MSAIGVFFAQVLPSVAGEGVRAWLLVRLGCDWRSAVTSVVIDRGVGVGLLIAIGFAILLLLPSGLTALGGYREMVLVFYGGMLLAAAFGLVLAPRIAPWLSRWRYSGWVATLAVDARRVLLGPYGPTILGIGCLVHVLTIVVIWSLGRAQGLLLPVSDAATLFTVMISVALVPISIGGWGLREVAVISLLGNHGVPPERHCCFRCASALLSRSALCPGRWRGCCIRLHPRGVLPSPDDERGRPVDRLDVRKRMSASFNGIRQELRPGEGTRRWVRSWPDHQGR